MFSYVVAIKVIESGDVEPLRHLEMNRCSAALPAESIPAAFDAIFSDLRTRAEAIDATHRVELADGRWVRVKN